MRIKGKCNLFALLKASTGNTRHQHTNQDPDLALWRFVWCARMRSNICRLVYAVRLYRLYLYHHLDVDGVARCLRIDFGCSDVGIIMCVMLAVSIDASDASENGIASVCWRQLCSGEVRMRHRERERKSFFKFKRIIWSCRHIHTHAICYVYMGTWRTTEMYTQFISTKWLLLFYFAFGLSLYAWLCRIEVVSVLRTPCHYHQHQPDRRCTYICCTIVICYWYNPLLVLSSS